MYEKIEIFDKKLKAGLLFKLIKKQAPDITKLKGHQNSSAVVVLY